MLRAWRPNAFRWQLAEPYPDADALARRLGTRPLIAQILANRGLKDFETAQTFLNPQLSDLHDPQELPGACEAAEYIAQAVRAGTRIVLYGDYDVDGITGVAILHACLRMVGADVHFYVPHRLEEGYGINAEALAKLRAQGAELLVTVDCGIGAVALLAEAKAAGLETIVTDHHGLPEKLPDCQAIVHPHLHGGRYPNAYLAGAGVAFKLAWQIARVICGEKRVDEPMRRFLLDATCLAALGTIADVVPLVGENRSLAMYGLRGLPTSEHPGLRALLESTNLTNSKLDAYHVGFVLAPRINACGRMGHARLAVELLTDSDHITPDRCEKIAKLLAQQNTKRQKIERAVTEEALARVHEQGLDDPKHRAIVLSSPDWHGGVIGIVASRLVDRFDRPVILVAVNGNGCGQGSGRSIPGFHMRDALVACSEHLLSFGGHAMAGGLRIWPKHLDAFTEAFEKYATENLSADRLQQTLAIDAEARLEQLDMSLAQDVARMAPFGQGNPQPVLAIRNCQILTAPKRMGRRGGTVGMLLAQNGVRIRAVGFGMGDLADQLIGVNTLDVAGEPVLNTFQGRTTVELKLKDAHWE